MSGDIATVVRAELQVEVMKNLNEKMASGKFSRTTGTWDGSIAGLESELTDLILTVATQRQLNVSRDLVMQMKLELISEFTSYGPLTRFLDDPAVTQIMVNRPDLVFIEREGKVTDAGMKFRDEEHVREIAARLLLHSGKRLDDRQPFADATLPDGSRVNIIIPPLAAKGTTITIRKIAPQRLLRDDLIRSGTLTVTACEFLERCVCGGLNLLISGSSESGKTTLLNILADAIPAGKRIITIEDTAELHLTQRNLCTLESRLPDEDDQGGIATRDLLRNALHMSADRIIIGEVRGPEALDMLQAMNTGHDGSMATVHSNSPRDTLARVETMIIASGVQIPIAALRGQIASACQLLVHMERMPNGSRQVTRITEISGMEGEVITLQDLFVYKQENSATPGGKPTGKLTATGMVPRFVDLLKGRGIEFPASTFRA